MRKHLITYVIFFIWFIIVVTLAVTDNTRWNAERRTSSYLDGCEYKERLYMIENLQDEGVLYVADADGYIQNVTKSSSVWKNSYWGKIACGDGLYGVLTRTEEEREEFRVVSFDDDGSVLALTPIFQLSEKGSLSGFLADRSGFYLTLVMDGGKEAGVFFIERGELEEIQILETDTEEAEETEETEAVDVPVVQLQELTICEEGRLIIEARYENGMFFLRRDDGSGVEVFVPSTKLQRAFQERDLGFKQWMKLRVDKITFYVQLFVIGCFALILILLTLRNRNHTVHTIVIVELLLLAITLTGVSQVPRIQTQAKEEEAQRFGFYYVKALAAQLRSPGQFDFDAEGFYDRNEYYEMRNILSRFVNTDEVSDIFMDVCLVRSSDHQILISASGYNRQRFEGVYAADSSKLFEELQAGDQKASMTIVVSGKRYQVLGVPVLGGLYPEYCLLGIMRQEDLSGDSDMILREYMIYAELMFLLGSMISILLLIAQDKELRSLARAMRDVAGGANQISKRTVRGKDVNLMWNSLMEIEKIISRINYTRYRIYESCYRFAPKNIERIMGKDSITEVKGGDMVLMQGTIAVLSSAEPKESGEKAAEQMNRFIAEFEKYQEKSEGFFISGQCDLAMMKLLFLEDARNTVESGTAFIQTFYEKKSLSALKTSIFLHYSQFTYGVAGTDIQSFPFLLSAEGQEIERYGEWLQSMGLRLVITGSVKDRENLKSESLRYIGYICIHDIPDKLRLYEVLDAYPYHERHLKQMTDSKFQNAIELFYKHDFYLARSTFSDVLKDNPEDHMAKWYLFTCEKYLNEAGFKGDICRLRWKE